MQQQMLFLPTPLPIAGIPLYYVTQAGLALKWET